MQRLEFRAMGCPMLAALDTGAQGTDRLAEVPGWFAEWEACLSRFRDDSELAELNRRSGSPTRVSEVLWDVIQAALQAAQRSGGLVTPTLLGALEQAGYDRSFDELQAAEVGATEAHDVGRLALLQAAAPRHNRLASGAIAHGSISRRLAALPTGDWNAIAWDARSRHVCLPPGVRLDLGGIAKGWAADRAARQLGAHGPALVDAGGDIAVSAPLADGSRWPIGVADPRDPAAQIDLLLLDRGGVATSGRDYRRWRQGEVWRHHILDPRTGLLVLEDGRVLRSRRLARYLWS